MGVEEWLASGRTEMRPLLLKVGVAVSLSLAGYLYSRISSRDDRLRPAPTVSGVDGVREACGGLKDELLHLQREDASSTAVAAANPTTVSPTISGLPLSTKDSEDEGGCLLPDGPESESIGVDTLALETTPVKSSPETKEKKIMEKQEIALLQTLVQSLQERETSMEIELLEYYGLREQESAVLELENHLKLSALGAELLSLKVKSLQAENRRLEAETSDYRRTKAALETARATIKHLKRKMKSDTAQGREKIVALLQSAAVKRLKELEGEVEKLRRANSKLSTENSDLANKLESMQIAASPTPAFPEATTSVDESNSLRQKNDHLIREIEQLRTDRCADVEELVYLRWVNACLRYELRNYQPPPGKVVARDLSRTLSPNSVHKVKQLIQEYASSGVNDNMSSNLVDLDSENCSSSQTSSSLKDQNGEGGNASTDASSTATKNSSNGKRKFLTKLKRLVLGKDMKNNKTPLDGSPASCGNSARRTSVSGCSFDEVIGRVSCDSAASCVTLDNFHGRHLMAGGAKAEEQLQQNESEWTRNLSRVSVDFQRLRNCEL